MSFIFHDRPMSTIDKAVYWVEYVIRHKGANHLRSPAVELKWYQYYLLDIAAFVILIIFIVFFIVKRITIFIYSLIVKPKKIKRS
jgi:glucuronosyltransferase